MRAIAIDEFGAPATVRDLPDPQAGPGEVLVRVHAAGVNPIDWKIQEGLFADLLEYRFPVVLGFDAAGVVEEVGADVDGLAAGDEVYGMLWKPVIGEGTYAQYVVAPAEMVARKPNTLGFAEAAALPMSALTALSCLDAVDPREAETLLVVGATGGVGSCAVQLAALRGARVIATARPENEEYALSLGAAETVDHRGGDPVEAVRSAHPGGVDAIIDAASGGKTLARYAGLLGKGGRLASTELAADVEGLAARGVGATNVFVLPDGERLAQIARMADAGELAVTVEDTAPLEEAAWALRVSKAGHVRGKLVLTVD